MSLDKVIIQYVRGESKLMKGEISVAEHGLHIPIYNNDAILSSEVAMRFISTQTRKMHQNGRKPQYRGLD